MADLLTDAPGLQRPRSAVHGVVGLVFAGIGMLASVLGHAFPLVVLGAVFLLDYPWWQVALAGLVGWMLYVALVLPILMNGSVMVTIWSAEPPWPSPELPVPAAPFARSWTALVASAPIVTYSTVFFTAVAVVRTIAPSSVAAIAGFVALLIATRLFIVAAQSRAAGRATILLLRTFRDHVTQWSLAGLLPALSAYGQVRTVPDPTLGRNAPINPEDVPLGEIEHVMIDGAPWQTVVEQCMREADCIVIDVTEPSPALGWEIGTAMAVAPAANIVLVCQPQALAPLLTEQPLFVRLVSFMERPPEEARERLRRLAPPMLYTDDLTNLVFCWRLYRRMHRVPCVQKRAGNS